MEPKTQKVVSLAIGGVGFVLLVMMITVESEPGAFPLALLLIAAVGYITGRRRERSSGVR
jgi:preprotein translocase subunit Sss1